MKIMFLSLTFCMLSGLSSDQRADMAIQTVKDFVNAADARNAAALEKILHPNFRVIANQTFGSKELSTMSKSDYLGLIQARKIGGDERSVEIHSLDIKGPNAIVRASFRGQALIFHTYIQLVESPEGTWQIISDMPFVEKV
ncbi:MAG: nuclear transport factor 2 family protein [Bacteroidetes bacterium]|nr:nuclear transport factor 2 family protein [Bacteroidota bacterium]